MSEKPFISVVTPAYRCATFIDELYQRLKTTLVPISPDFEIIFVNDASPENDWEFITKLAKKDPRVKGINFSRNFGQHHAITAGLDHAQGEWVVVMDCDLQDQPEEIPKLYQKALEGWDVVVGRRAQRKDYFLKKLTSKLFYNVFEYFTGQKVDNRIGNFGIYAKKVIHSVSQLREHSRSFGLFVIWTGFKRIEIDIIHAKREIGNSSYNFIKRLNLAIDSIVTHSNKPLKLSVKLGFLLSSFSILYAIWMVISYFIWSTPVAGWTSLIVSLYFLAGLIIGSIGMVGLYVGKMFDETKKRPLYIITETTFDAKNE